MTITHTVPKSIPTSRDATDQLNKWIASVPDGKPGARIDLSFARKQFIVDGTLMLQNRNHLRFRDGGTHTSVVGDSHRAHWRAVDGSDLAWLNVKVVGPRQRWQEFDPARQWQHGFDFQGLNGYDLAACTIQKTLGDGVCNGYGSAWTRNGRIHATCRFDSPGRMTVAFTAAQDIIVDAVRVTDPCLSIFDVESNGRGWGGKRILVDGATVSDFNPAHQHALLYVGDTVGTGFEIEDVTVRNCALTGYSVMLVSKQTTDRYQHVTFINNKSDTIEHAVADVYAIDGLVVTDNAIPAGNVHTHDCTDVSL